MSAASSRSASRSGTPLGTRPHSNNTTTASSLSSLTPTQPSFGKESDSGDGNVRPEINKNNSSHNNNNNHQKNNYFSYPVSRVMSGLYRRFTDPPSQEQQQQQHKSRNGIRTDKNNNHIMSSRSVSPFQPPPLTPLTLKSSSHAAASTATTQHILSRALAEEIRLLVPPRVQLIDTWRLAYSLDRDGSSLATLYDCCRQIAERNPRAGYVLVVRDASDGGAVFGAYLTDPPHPSSHFYGTGECFLWRASVLASTPVFWSNHQNHSSNDNDDDDDDNDPANGHEQQPDKTSNNHNVMTDEELRKAGFPPPPSADTTHAVRSTTLRASTPTQAKKNQHPQKQPPTDPKITNLLPLPGSERGGSGTSTPERIRFKAFPYSGINDYMMFCETGFLSVGGG